MANTDGWQTLYDLLPPTTSHPEEEGQRRRFAAQDAQRRARLPEWEAALPGAEAAVAEKRAAVDAARAALAVATDANGRKYKLVTGGSAVRDPQHGLPIAWLDDERCEPELTRRKLAEQVLSAAQAELTPAVGWQDWLINEIASIRGTIPARV